MRFFSKEFWTTEEVQNQFLHFLAGFAAAFIAFVIFRVFWIAFVIGCVPGLVMEGYQVIGKKETTGPQWEDHICDFLFYMFGAIAPFVCWLYAMATQSII